MIGKTNTFDEKAKSWDDNPERAYRAQVITDAIIEEIPFNSRSHRTGTQKEFGVMIPRMFLKIGAFCISPW
jgi:hypothetical protein